MQGELMKLVWCRVEWSMNRPAFLVRAGQAEYLITLAVWLSFH